MQVQKKVPISTTNASGCEGGICAPHKLDLPDITEAVARADRALRPKIDQKYVKALKLLKRAKKIISDPKNWIKGRLWEGKNHHYANKFCALGALQKANGTINMGYGLEDSGGPLAAVFLEDSARETPFSKSPGSGSYFRSVPQLNDCGHTEHPDVMALYDRAIDNLKAKARSEKKE